MASQLHVRASLIALLLVGLIGEPARAQLLPTLTKADAAGGKKLDLTFVPKDAVAAIVIQPRRLLTGPFAGMFPPQFLELVGKREIGVEARDLEQAVLVFGMPRAGACREPNAAVLLRLTKATDAAVVASAIVPDGRDRVLQGKKVRHAKQSSDLSLA